MRRPVNINWSCWGFSNHVKSTSMCGFNLLQFFEFKLDLSCPVCNISWRSRSLHQSRALPQRPRSIAGNDKAIFNTHTQSGHHPDEVRVLFVWVRCMVLRPSHPPLWEAAFGCLHSSGAGAFGGAQAICNKLAQSTVPKQSGRVPLCWPFRGSHSFIRSYSFVVILMPL